MKIEMEGWWDKETARLLAVLDLQQETEKEGNRGGGLNMSAFQIKFGFF